MRIPLVVLLAASITLGCAKSNDDAAVLPSVDAASETWSEDDATPDSSAPDSSAPDSSAPDTGSDAPPMFVDAGPSDADVEPDDGALPPGVEIIGTGAGFMLADADHVYWSKTTFGGSTTWDIWSFEKTGASPPKLLLSGYADFGGLAQAGDYLYFTASASLGADLSRVAKSGGVREPIVRATNGGKFPLISGSTITWYEDPPANTRFAAALDGSGKRDIGYTGFPAVVAGGDIYYVRTSGITRVSVTTGASSSFYDGPINISSLATDGAYIYWKGDVSPGDTPELARAPVVTGSPVTRYPGAEKGFAALAVDGENIYWSRDVYPYPPRIVKQPVSGATSTTLLGNAGSLKLVDEKYVYFTQYKTTTALMRIKK